MNERIDQIKQPSTVERPCVVNVRHHFRQRIVFHHMRGVHQDTVYVCTEELSLSRGYWFKNNPVGYLVLPATIGNALISLMNTPSV